MNPSDLLPPELAEEDPVLDAAAQMEEAASTLDLEDAIVQRLQRPLREITVHLPLSRDLGETTLITGYRVQHCRARAGCIGPVLLAPTAHLAQLRPLAQQLTLQCALLNLALGGSAGALVCDPAQMSESELRCLLGAYVSALDVRGDIFAPVNFAAAWTHGDMDLGCVAGKPAALGGIPDLASAIAAGWFTILSEAVAWRGLALPKCRVAVQGFAPATESLAGRLRQEGARILALADRSGGLLAREELDIDAISAHVAHQGVLYGFASAEAVTNCDVLESAADVLVLADGERQINLQNESRIRAPLILEAAHHAITPAARQRLTSRGTVVVPALLGTAPATLAWFAEWQHGLRYAMPEQEAVESEIGRRILEVLRRIRSAAQAHNRSVADIGLTMALQQFAAVLRVMR